MGELGLERFAQATPRSASQSAMLHSSYAVPLAMPCGPWVSAPVLPPSASSAEVRFSLSMPLAYSNSNMVREPGPLPGKLWKFPGVHPCTGAVLGELDPQNTP